MSARSFALLAAAFAFTTTLAAGTAFARTTHKAAHAPSKSAAPALIVRGDQVSTEGLVGHVASAFDATGDGRLEIQPFNTVSGIDDTLAGTVDIAASARPAYFRRPQEAGLTFTPVAWGALVLITNEANPVANLTLKQVHDIYYGQIKNWSELGGANEPIDLDGVAIPLDGTQFSFRRLILGNGDGQVAVPRLFINIDSLQQEVSLDPKALAVSTLAYARRQKGIRVIPLEGVMPSVATLENGTYPLPMRIYLAYKPDNPKLPTIQKFLAFMQGPQAQGILRNFGLLPDNQAVVLNSRSVEDRIDAISKKMLAEGLPAEYAPSNELQRLMAGSPEFAKAVAAEQADAVAYAKANQQQITAAESVTAPAPAPVAAVVASGTYTVTRGDTLSKIARAHSITVADLRKWNSLRSDEIRIGQVLQLSAR